MIDALFAMVVIFGISRVFVLDKEFPPQLWSILYGASAASALTLSVLLLIEACG